MIQRREWMPLSQPGLQFVIEWNDSFADAPHRCVWATRNGDMLHPPQVHYENALRLEESRREGDMFRAEEAIEGGIRFSLGKLDGGKVFKDALYLPDGLTPAEIKTIQDERYANWLAVAYPGPEIVSEAAVIADGAVDG